MSSIHANWLNTYSVSTHSPNVKRARSRLSLRSVRSDRHLFCMKWFSLALLLLCPLSSYGQTSVRPVYSLFGFGDSYVYGVGATDPASTGGFALLAQSTHALSYNYAVAGTTAPQISASAFAYFAPSPTMPSVTLIDAGANDGSTETCKGAASSTCTTDFKQAMNAGIAWVTIPYSSRIMASAAQQSGTWSADSTLPIYATPLIAPPGSPLWSATAGSSLSFAVSTSESNSLGLTYEVTDSQAGTFTVSIDDHLVNNACSGTTTFSSAPCSAQLLGTTSTFFRQEYSVAPNQAHTVVITATNASRINVTSVDVIPPSTATNTNAAFVMGPDAIFTYSNVYDAALLAVASQLNTDGLPVYFVDLINGTPGVNATTDIATVATADCNASLLVNHPNDQCGYYHMLQTIQNAQTAANYVFSSFAGSGTLPDVVLDPSNVSLIIGPTSTPTSGTVSGSNSLTLQAKENKGGVITDTNCSLTNNISAVNTVISLSLGCNGVPAGYYSVFSDNMFTSFNAGTVSPGNAYFGSSNQAGFDGDGNFTSSSPISTTKTVSAAQLVSIGAVPTITNGPGVGTLAGTPTIVGSNMAGVITVVTGKTTRNLASLATITFAGALPTAPLGCTLMPRNAVAASAGTTIYTSAPTTTSWTLNTGNTALATVATYIWSYFCV